MITDTDNDNNIDNSNNKDDENKYDNDSQRKFRLRNFRYTNDISVKLEV